MSPDHILKYDLDFQCQKSFSSESPWPPGSLVMSQETEIKAVMVDSDMIEKGVTEDQKTIPYRRWARTWDHRGTHLVTETTYLSSHSSRRCETKCLEKQIIPPSLESEHRL